MKQWLVNHWPIMFAGITGRPVRANRGHYVLVGGKRWRKA